MELSFQILGVVSGVLMPLFNIPLILRIARRRSSEDISVAWVVGVWFASSACCRRVYNPRMWSCTLSASSMSSSLPEF
jgi:hypothetical protein